jgi:MAP/microtubule affinity-regulating kinase
MELVEGISLLDLLKSRENRRIDENESRKIFSQLVNAIAFCHSKNIIHRDIKLENIIVDSNFNLKLIDFGFGAVSPSNKLQSFFCGTPSYMPPEIVQKKDYIGIFNKMKLLFLLN